MMLHDSDSANTGTEMTKVPIQLVAQGLSEQSLIRDGLRPWCWCAQFPLQSHRPSGEVEACHG